MGPRQSYMIGADGCVLHFGPGATLPSFLAYRNGAPVRVSDVANVVDGTSKIPGSGGVDEWTPAVIVNIQRQPGANVIEVVDRMKQLLSQLHCLAAIDRPGERVDRSHHHDSRVRWRCAARTDADGRAGDDGDFSIPPDGLRHFIPTIAVPFSLVGTFGVMYLIGYSLNNLTLMALTISTGFVVDDAIVMIENIARYIEEGESPLEAALLGSKQIGFTIVSLTISLIAVLIPLLFMGDVVGGCSASSRSRSVSPS